MCFIFYAYMLNSVVISTLWFLFCYFIFILTCVLISVVYLTFFAYSSYYYFFIVNIISFALFFCRQELMSITIIYTPIIMCHNFRKKIIDIFNYLFATSIIYIKRQCFPNRVGFFISLKFIYKY